VFSWQTHGKRKDKENERSKGGKKSKKTRGQENATKRPIQSAKWGRKQNKKKTPLRRPVGRNRLTSPQMNGITKKQSGNVLPCPLQEGGKARKIWEEEKGTEAAGRTLNMARPKQLINLESWKRGYSSEPLKSTVWDL